MIIPKPFLAEIGAVQAVEMTAHDGRIVIEPVKRPARQGWAEASGELAEAGDDALIWPEFGNADDALLEW